MGGLSIIQIKPTKCSDCDKIFTNTSDLSEHMAIHDPTGSSDYECSYCSAVFDTWTEIQDHFENSQKWSVQVCRV